MPIKSKYLCNHRDEAVFQFTLENENGLKAVLLNLGATLQQMWIPDREGQFADVVLGFDDVEPYASTDNPYFGATVGACANRIDRGQFSLNGKDYQLAINNGANHLHGGPVDGLTGKSGRARSSLIKVCASLWMLPMARKTTLAIENSQSPIHLIMIMNSSSIIQPQLIKTPLST